MMKSLVCIALLFAVLVAVHGRPGRGGPGGGGFGGGDRGFGGGGRRPGYGGNQGQWVSGLCANNSALAQQFVTQTQALISTLQSNGSFGQVLTARAQQIAYIQNADNTALLSSNCTAYFSGLQSAKTADQQALQTQQQYQKTAGQLFRQIIQSLVGDDSGSGEK